MSTILKPRFQCGSRVGPFEIMNLIGIGGMAEVYLALDPDLRRTVALKTLRATDQASTERFLREAQTCARLRHRCIVTVHGFGLDGDTVYMAMEYLEGRTLHDLISAGPTDLLTGLDILSRILEGLAHAHDRGVTHCDIKPSNVQLLPDGTIKLLDFGIANIRDPSRFPSTKEVAGTLGYMSPEQMRGDVTDQATDIYSTGVLAYELFTGRRLYDQATKSTILARVLYVAIPPMSMCWSGAFPEVEALIVRAIATKPADRFPSAGDMRLAVRAALARLVGPGSRPDANDATLIFNAVPPPKGHVDLRAPTLLDSPPCDRPDTHGRLRRLSLAAGLALVITGSQQGPDRSTGPIADTRVAVQNAQALHELGTPAQARPTLDKLPRWPPVIPETSTSGMHLVSREVTHSDKPNASQEPAIAITDLPCAMVGGPDTETSIGGQVVGIDEVDDKWVVLYAWDKSFYFVQPLAAAPLTPVRRNRTWSTWTHGGGRYAALLVRKPFTPREVIATLPAVAGNVVAAVEVPGSTCGTPPRG